MNDAILTVLIAMLGGAIRVSTPFMFVALGECLTEKSGRVNLGLEGTLVLGAMVAYAASYHSGSPWLGVLAAGYGFTGILVSFLARHNPVVIVPVAILFGGLVASGGLIQRRMDLPDATVLVLQGLIFVVLLTSETLYGRFSFFKPIKSKDRT